DKRERGNQQHHTTHNASKHARLKASRSIGQETRSATSLALRRQLHGRKGARAFQASDHTQTGDSRGIVFCDDRLMATDLLHTLSNQLADSVDSAAPSVVQVQGRRRPASGLVYADNVVLTTVRAIGRGDAPHVRRGDGTTLAAELAG